MAYSDEIRDYGIRRRVRKVRHTCRIIRAGGIIIANLRDPFDHHSNCCNEFLAGRAGGVVAKPWLLLFAKAFRLLGGGVNCRCESRDLGVGGH